MRTSVDFVAGRVAGFCDLAATPSAPAANDADFRNSRRGILLGMGKNIAQKLEVGSRKLEPRNELTLPSVYGKDRRECAAPRFELRTSNFELNPHVWYDPSNPRAR